MPNFSTILGYITSCYSKQKWDSSCQLIGGRPIILVLIGRIFQLGSIRFPARVRTRILGNGNRPHPHCHWKIWFKHPRTFYILPKPFVFCWIVILGIVKLVYSILQPSCWFKPWAVSQVRRVKGISSQFINSIIKSVMLLNPMSYISDTWKVYRREWNVT